MQIARTPCFVLPSLHLNFRAGKMTPSSRVRSYNPRFTDLPKGVHLHICRMVRDDGPIPQPVPYVTGFGVHKYAHPLEISLLGVKATSSPFPPHLLPLAQSSRALATSVAELLGDFATALTANNTKTKLLPQWATALREHAKAVSAWDREAVYVESMGSHTMFPHLSPENVLKDNERLLSALGKAAIPLQVLDVSNVNLHKVEKAKEKIADDLRETLKAAEDSLRELAVPVSDIAAKAISQVALPGLETLELHFKDVLAYVASVDNDCASDMFGFADMLQAVEQQMGSDSKIRELRLFSLLEAPFWNVNEPKYCPLLCNTVTSLQVMDSSWLYVKKPKEDDAIALFISLFPNLKRLQWNGDVTPKHLQTIMKGCPSLERLILNLRNLSGNFSEQGGLSSGHGVRDKATIADIFAATQGKLCGLTLAGHMSVEQWNTLGECSPFLESVRTEIGRQTVGALVPLLGTQCRNIRRLCLSFTEDVEESLGAEGWATFASAVQSASAELREVILISVDEREPMELDLEEMLDAMVAVIESLGDRASEIRFHSPSGTTSYRVVVTAMIRLVRAAAQHARNVKHLSFALHVADAEYDWGGDEDIASQLWQELLDARKELRENTPLLRTLFLDGLDQEAEEYFDEHWDEG